MQSETFLSSFLPFPPQPRRLFATFIISTFLLTVAWIAVTDTTDYVPIRGLGRWAHVKSIVWQVEKGGSEMGEGDGKDWGTLVDGMLGVGTPGPVVGGSGVDFGTLPLEDTDRVIESEGEDGQVGLEESEVLDEGLDKKEDWSKIVWHSHQNVGKRLIVVGDVHGMYSDLDRLLDLIEYTPNSQDTLIVTGDLITKHPDPSASISTLNLLESVGGRSVRGNWDQTVIEWRTWMEAKGRLPKVSEVNDEDEDISDEEGGQLEGKGWMWLDGEDEISTLSIQDQEELKERKKTIPKGWEWGSQAFTIARKLSRKNYKFLLSLPLTIYLDDINSYVVHAGLLPSSLSISSSSDTSMESTEEDSTMTTVEDVNSMFPDLPPILRSLSPFRFLPNAKVSRLLKSSIRTSLLLFPPNREPFTLQNMRGVKVSKKGKVKISKSAKEGNPWMEFWEKDDESENGKDVNVIYGHWAGMGLRIGKRTLGLDSGCVYGRRLSALVMMEKGAGGDEEPFIIYKKKGLETEEIEWGGRKAAVVSIGCKMP